MFSRTRSLQGDRKIAAPSVLVPTVEALEPRQLLSGSKIAPPVAPSNVAATADPASASIRVTWSDNSGKESGYVVKRKKGRSGAWVTVATLPANSVYFRSGGLAAGTSYSYSVSAFNRGGYSAFTTAVSATTYTVGMAAIDGRFGTGGDATDSTWSEADHLAFSPDASTVYAASYQYSGANANNPGIDAFPATTGGSVSFAGGKLFVNTVLPTSIAYIVGIAVQSDGKVVIAGRINSNDPSAVIARFNADGTLDTTFAGGTGELVTNFGDQEQVNALAIGADNSIYIAGDDALNGVAHQQLFSARLTPDGAVDTTYGTNGIISGLSQTVTLNATVEGYQFSGERLALDPTDNSVVIAAQFALVDNMGVVDPGSLVGGRFSTTGVVSDSFTYSDRTAESAGDIFPEAVLIDANHKIVVVGQGATGAFSQRFNTNGTTDSTWAGPGNSAASEASSGVAALYGIAQRSDGSYVVAGHGAGGGAIVGHLNASDGSLIGSYTVHASVAPSGAASTEFYTLTIAPDGSIYAGGMTDASLLVSKFQILS